MDWIPGKPFSRPTSPDAALAHGRAWMVLSALLFGAMAVAARAASHTLPAAEVAFVRFVIGIGATFSFAALRPGSLRPTNLSLLALRGAFGGAAVLSYFVAMEKLNAGLGTLLNNTYPLWGAFIAAVFLGERLTARTLSGFFVAGIGLVGVIGPGEAMSAARGLSDVGIRWAMAAGLASGMLGGFATTIIRKLRRTESAVSVLAAFCIGGAVVCLGPALRVWRPIGAREAALLLLVGALSFGAQLIFTYALKFVPTSGSVVNLLTVVASYGFAALFLGEDIALHALVGGVIVMAGVYLASTTGARSSGTAAPVAVPDVES